MGNTILTYNPFSFVSDEKGETLSSPFMTLPNKRKVPRYYVRIREPLDFSTVEQNINSGLYSTLEAFDQDICKILNNNLKYYGRTNALGIASVRLNKIYLEAKKEAYPQLVDVLGETLPPSFVAEKDTGRNQTQDSDFLCLIHAWLTCVSCLLFCSRGRRCHQVHLWSISR